RQISARIASAARTGVTDVFAIWKTGSTNWSAMERFHSATRKPHSSATGQTRTGAISGNHDASRLTPSNHCRQTPAMTDAEIWRTAVLLVEERGLHAQYEAMTRASVLKAAGDDPGAAAWLKVFDAVEEVWRTEREGNESLQ
ncbi:MAG: hypothetical protein M1423_05440, partial [Acidobacteria bacterium]|nr:hypothetical protein [Acidobacteriota bacterium]